MSNDSSGANTSGAISYLLDFGPTATKQFAALARKLGMNVNEVMSDAWLILITRKPKFDPTRGTLSNYLWGHLISMYDYKTQDVVCYAASIDDESEIANYLRSILQTQVEDPIIPLDVYTTDCGSDSVLRGFLNFAERLSGKTAAEFAIERECTKRNVNYTIKKMIQKIEAYRKNKKLNRLGI